MRKISTEDLRELEVVNICNGEKIGYPTDFEFDMECCQILSIIVASCNDLPFFGKHEEYIIPWSKIECIGEDTILVKLHSAETFCCEKKRKKKK